MLEHERWLHHAANDLATAKILQLQAIIFEYLSSPTTSTSTTQPTSASAASTNFGNNRKPVKSHKRPVRVG